MNPSGSTVLDATPLPKSWIWQTLRDMLKVRNGFAFKSADYRERGVLLIRQSNLAGNRVSLEKAEYLPEHYLKEYSEFEVNRGDILIGMSGSIGKLCVYDRDEPALQNQRTGLLKFKDDSLKRWVWHYLPTVEGKLLKGGKGVGVQNISASQIEALPIPLAPKNERDHIVAEIEKQFSRLDEAVANLKRVKANLKRYRVAVLKAAVEGKLTAAWRKAHPDVEPASELLKRILAERRAKWSRKGKYKEPDGPDTVNLPLLPEGYTWATYEQLCRIQGGFAFKSREYVKEGIPLVRISNLVNGHVRLSENTVFLPNAFESEYAEFLLRKDDVLIAMSGATTGKMATMDKDVPALLNQRVGRFVFSSPSLCNGKFVSFLVKQISPKVLEDAYGAAQPNISPAEIEAMPVPLPPLIEQKRIVAEVDQRLSVVEELEAQVAVNLQRVERLRGAVLRDAFTGKLAFYRNQPSDNSWGGRHAN